MWDYEEALKILNKSPEILQNQPELTEGIVLHLYNLLEKNNRTKEIKSLDRIVVNYFPEIISEPITEKRAAG